MTSQEPAYVNQDLFAVEVQLFQADVDLALRGGLVSPVTANRSQDVDDLPGDLAPSSSTTLLLPWR